MTRLQPDGFTHLYMETPSWAGESCLSLFAANQLTGASVANANANAAEFGFLGLVEQKETLAS